MVKRWVVLATVVLVAAAAVTTVVLLTRSDRPVGGDTGQSGPPRVYAYTMVDFGKSWMETNSDLVVMDGTRRVGRTSLGLLGTDPAFTVDGRYAFSLPMAGSEVIAISVATGKVTKVTCEGCSDRNLECQCQTVVPIGGSEIAWLDSTNHLVLADLAANTPAPRQATATVPTSRNSYKDIQPQLFAGTNGSVLAAYPDPLAEEAGPVYVVTPDDPPRQLTPNRPDGMESATFSPDGTKVALAGAGQQNTCATVTIVDIASGQGQTSPVMAAPGAICAPRDGYVGEMWWDHDGVLNAYYQPNGQDSLIGASQRRLDGDRWVAADVEPVSQAHKLNEGATALLSHPGVRDQDVLYVEIDGHRTRIERKVNQVTAAPR
jgi:hypothetical protein